MQHSLGWQNKWRRSQGIGLFPPRLSLLKGMLRMTRKSPTPSRMPQEINFVLSKTGKGTLFFDTKTELLPPVHLAFSPRRWGNNDLLTPTR